MNPNGPAPDLSIVVLTWNEEANVADCLASLAAQEDKGFEVILVDAASTDRTLAIAQREAVAFPVPLRIHAHPTKLPIGAARNLGVQMARAPLVAFLSADAEAEPDWTRRARQALATHDMAFGRQLHRPRKWTVGAAVRGLRYQFPEGPAQDPLPFASNVAAAYRKDVLLANPFDDWANASEDLLLARRAVAQGRTATYDPGLVVRHHDVPSAGVEWRKNVREGHGWGVYRAELGYLQELLAWGGVLAAATAWALLRPGWLSLATAAAIAWAPAVRRAVRRRRDNVPPLWRFLGVLASPVFDLAFLANYVRGLATRPAPPSDPSLPTMTTPPLQETRP